jgi:hypothetical protein
MFVASGEFDRAGPDLAGAVSAHEGFGAQEPWPIFPDCRFERV